MYKKFHNFRAKMEILKLHGEFMIEFVVVAQKRTSRKRHEDSLFPSKLKTFFDTEKQLQP